MTTGKCLVLAFNLCKLIAADSFNTLLPKYSNFPVNLQWVNSVLALKKTF